MASIIDLMNDEVYHESVTVISLDPLRLRRLIHNPTKLQEYITNHGDIPDADKKSMICRCIETGQGESLRILLTKVPRGGLDIKLLPGRCGIDDELYLTAKHYGVRDIYYEASLRKEKLLYQYEDVVTQQVTFNQYVGYRDVYHALMYGSNEHLQAIIVRWDLYGEDHTVQAARDYFNFSPNCPIFAIKARIGRIARQ